MEQQKPISASKAIDIKKVFYQKSPKIAKLIPGFIYRYIKKIVHEDFLNDFMARYGDKIGVDFANAAILDFNVEIKVNGLDKLPNEGKYIFVANHPLGGFDGLILISLLSKKYPSVKFLVNDILMNIPNWGELFIPINKHGGQARDAARIIEEAYASQTQILTFPSGLVSRKIKGQIVDLEWKPSFVKKAVQYKRDIIPVHFSGQNTNFFYNLSKVRNFLGIKTNLEMFYLVDETYKHRNKKIKVTFGEPIPYSGLDPQVPANEWAQRIKEKVYSLVQE
jgi:putative hemolysin